MAGENSHSFLITNPVSQISNNDSSADIVCNAEMCVGEIRQFCKLPAGGQSLMRAMTRQINLSARACHLILKQGKLILTGRKGGDPIRALGGGVVVPPKLINCVAIKDLEWRKLSVILTKKMLCGKL